MAIGKGLQEAELRAGLQEGGQVQGLIVVSRGDGDAVEHAIYVRTSWTRGYRILRTWRDKADRTFRSLDKLFKLPPTFGYYAPVTVYRQGCAELQRFRGVLARDLGARDGTADAAGSPDEVTSAGRQLDPPSAD